MYGQTSGRTGKLTVEAFTGLDNFVGLGHFPWGGEKFYPSPWVGMQSLRVCHGLAGQDCGPALREDWPPFRLNSGRRSMRFDGLRTRQSRSVIAPANLVHTSACTSEFVG